MKKTAMAFGSFDLLHPGHVHYLKSASRYGKLIVVLSRDSSIRKLKGHDPIFNENARLAMVKSLKCVDRAVIGNEIKKQSDLYKIVAKFRPDVIVLGYDQRVDTKGLTKFLKAKRMSAKIVRSKPFCEKDLKSSKIAAKIMRMH